MVDDGTPRGPRSWSPTPWPTAACSLPTQQRLPSSNAPQQAAPGLTQRKIWVQGPPPWPPPQLTQSEGGHRPDLGLLGGLYETGP